MKYKIFATEAEALAAEATLSQEMGYAKPGVNAKTGQPVPDVLTLRWAIPQQITDGRWVFPSHDDEGIESEASWWPVDETPY
jgi:hypothetical protein